MVSTETFKPPSAKEGENSGRGCCFPIRMRKRKSRDRTLDDQEIERLFGHNPRAFSASPVGALLTTWGDLKAAN